MYHWLIQLASELQDISIECFNGQHLKKSQVTSSLSSSSVHQLPRHTYSCINGQTHTHPAKFTLPDSISKSSSFCCLSFCSKKKPSSFPSSSPSPSPPFAIARGEKLESRLCVSKSHRSDFEWQGQLCSLIHMRDTFLSTTILPDRTLQSFSLSLSLSRLWNHESKMDWLCVCETVRSSDSLTLYCKKRIFPSSFFPSRSLKILNMGHPSITHHSFGPEVFSPWTSVKFFFRPPTLSL